MNQISHSLQSETIIDWLLAQNKPWVTLNTYLDLLDRPVDSPEVRAAYKSLRHDEQVATILDEAQVWPQATRLKKAYDPKDTLWKLAILADFGLKRDDELIQAVAQKVLDLLAGDPHPPGFLHGGFDHTRGWDERPYICISHVMTYALARFGYLDDPRVQAAYDCLESWQTHDGGWHPNEKNRPGGVQENEPSCPFGTVNILRAISANPALRDSPIAERAVENVLTLWQRRAEPYRPVGFGMGTTFNKLQYPFVQHQLLKTVDTLSNFPSALQDERFVEMVTAVTAKQSPDGTFTTEGINKPYAGFDFGQKKQPSAWITFLVVRTQHRLGS
ncbi:MAG: hypothetical protein KC419_21580 [Anaerolineales bacterium]|nr:hypothetical protein [Anaerolineales bacterium]